MSNMPSNCSACGIEIRASSWQPCHCATSTRGGHRSYWCDACGRFTYDPPCAGHESTYAAR